MKKQHIAPILILTLLLSYTTRAQDTMKHIGFATTFISDFKSYRMDIQAAGIATIPVATISEKSTLYIEYAYTAGGENRNGKMTLALNPNTNRFEGDWKTVADNGNAYQGDLYFEFKDNGQADGFYHYGGINYKITIFKE